jgi:hypothetical protein
MDQMAKSRMKVYIATPSIQTKKACVSTLAMTIKTGRRNVDVALGEGLRMPTP